MATIINDEFLDKYFRKGYVHPSRDAAVKMYEALRVHFNGDFPKDLIRMRRPNESPYLLDYREKTYKPKSKIICTRVLSSLSKIRRSPDWSVSFPAEKPSSVPDEFSLEQYINYKFPIFKSITMWLFSVCIKNYLIDSNAVCAIIPRNTNEELDSEKTYINPFPYIFNSNQVIDYVPEQYCILESADLCTYVDGGRTYTDGKVYIILTDNQYVRYEQFQSDGKMKRSSLYNHRIGRLPAFKLRGQYKTVDKGEILWESRISGMLPELDDFVSKQSDLDAQIVQHVYSEKWAWAPNDDCNSCGGLGQVELTDGATTCPDCKGTKKTVASPYMVTKVRPTNQNLGEQPAPLPPFGYISKESVAEMTRLLDELLDKCEHSALAAVNMEFLSKVPLAVSGTSKMVDRDEANNTVHAICEDIVSIADDICYFVNEYRYSRLVPEARTRAAMLPSIAVPEVYDLVNTSILLDEMKKAVDCDMSAEYIAKMQVEIAAKKYPNDPNFAKLMECYAGVDPFSSVTDDEKLSRLQNGGITEDDYILSSNVKLFVGRAVEKDQGFMLMTLEEQRAVLLPYIEEVKKANAAASQLDNKIPIQDPIIPPVE